MNKEAHIPKEAEGALKGMVNTALSVKPGNIGKTYHKYIGSRPILESLLAGGTLGYGAYKAAPYIAKPILKRFMHGASEQEIEQTLREAKREGRIKDVGKTLGMAGAAAGALYPFLKSTNFSGSLGDAARSYIGRDVYSQDEPIAKYDRALHKKREFDKVSSFQDALTHTRIPVSYSLDLIKSDPFLREQDKAITSAIVDGSEDGSGITTGNGIIRTAIRAGVGFVPAYAFGKFMTNLTNIPEPAAKRMSMAGGLAGAIYNTGLIQELGK